MDDLFCRAAYEIMGVCNRIFIQYDISRIFYACTVRFAVWKVWSLVPTLILKTPGSTTHEFWSDHTASCEERTLIDTVADLPALKENESDVLML